MSFFSLGGGPLKISLIPLLVKKKIVRIIGFMVFKSTGLISLFQCKNRFWKICTGSRDIGQNVSNFTGLVWKADFGQFFGCIFFKTDFCVETVSPSRSIWIPWTPLSEQLFFSLIKGSVLSSGPFQIRFRASDLNFVFCVCSPKPNRTFLEPRQIRYWKK